MVRLLLIAILFSSCTKGQVIGVYNGGAPVAPQPVTPPRIFDTLMQNGNFYPATTLTPEVQKYQNFEKGWLIDLQMNTFYGSWADAVAAVNAPDPRRFDVQYVNVAKWADSAVVHNLDYAVLNVLNEYGFKLWRSRTPYNMQTIRMFSGHQSPAYNDYSVQPLADTGIVWKFVNEFRSRGIEPVAYINSAWDFNTLHGTIVSSNVPNSRYLEQKNYICRLIQELIITFGFKYLWIDYAFPIPAGFSQDLYNAAKSADPTVQIIGNALGETNFSKFPYDIASTEEHAIYGGNIGYRTNEKVHNGTTYYIGQEIVATPYGNMSQWYYYDSQVSFLPTVNPFTNLPPWVNLQETTPASFQTVVNAAKTYARPFLACMLVDRRGNLIESNLTYLRNLNWIR